MLPPVIPPTVSIVTKLILSLVCCIIWGALWVYYDRQIKALKVECAKRKAEEAEMEKLDKIRQGLQAED